MPEEAMDPGIRQVIDECRRFMADRDDALALPEDAAQFVHALVLAIRPRRVLEIGTSYGWSGLWIGAALRLWGGRLVTIDHAEHKHAYARAAFERAGLAGTVDARLGEAAEVLAGLDGPFEFVLNDADKAGAVAYFQRCREWLPPGGVFLTDNAVSHAEALGGFLRLVRAQRGWFSTLVPVGNGMEMTVRCE